MSGRVFLYGFATFSSLFVAVVIFVFHHSVWLGALVSLLAMGSAYQTVTAWREKATSKGPSGEKRF